MKRRILLVAVLAAAVGAGAAMAASSYHVHEFRVFLMEKPARFSKTQAELKRHEPVEIISDARAKDGWMEVKAKGKQGWLPLSAITVGAPLAGAGSERVGKATDRQSVQLAARGFSPEVEAEHAKANPDLDYALVDAVEATVTGPSEVATFASAGSLKLGGE